MTADMDAALAFWQYGLSGEVVADLPMGGSRNVFMRVGAGRLRLCEQAPEQVGPGTIRHLGVQTDELVAVLGRLGELGASVSEVRKDPGATYVMVQGPDGVLLELFQPNLSALPASLRGYFGGS
jgi:catechol 2,3-dioxygenase-like lactoylglutathione lyase family enzyme